MECVKEAEAKQTGMIKLDLDGKVCETASVNGKIVHKDHISVVCGVCGKYVDHYTPRPTGSGRNIATGMVKLIIDTNSAQTLRALGCGEYLSKF